MKRVIIIAAALALCAFKISENFSAAQVEQQQGCYVFYCSKPTSEYKYLGTVKPKWFDPMGKPEMGIAAIIKRAKESYPQADGVIINITMSSADAIQFNNK